MAHPAESIPEIMRRTKTNLEFIQRERDARQNAGHAIDIEGPFEITQLVNSFMGAFAHPFEALFKLKNPSERIQKDLKILEDVLLKEAWWVGDAPSLATSLGYVRNAFAHGNIEYIGGIVEERDIGSSQDIVGIRIWNCKRTGKPFDGWQEQTKTWEKNLTVRELETMLLAFVDAMSSVDPRIFERETDCPPVRC